MLPRPVIFGEVLFDRFTDRETLGGAPFNVAWHLRGFGMDPLFLSSVGRDSLGGRVFKAMTSWGLDTAGLEESPHHPTGTVQVTVEGGQPKYEIVPEQAYDYIQADGIAERLGQDSFGPLYHGSLALRHPVSRGAFFELRRRAPLARFIDINLREPWWERRQVLEWLRGAETVKLNDEELTALGDSESNLRDAAMKFRDRHGIGALVVTLGERGAFALANGDLIEVPPAPAANVVDTVGAGDGFSAVTIAGLIHGWPWPVILRRANHFAAKVCGWRGAFPQDAAPYRETLEQWRNHSDTG